jgi:anaerobic magnesium-protoporphyrin IX monomethyl ester cyclase
MDVTLINVPDSDVYQKFKRPNIKNLPLGLAYIAGALETEGYEVEIIDAVVNKIDYEDIAEEAAWADVVGISSTTPTIINALDILKRIKSKNPDVITVIGGPHVSAVPQQVVIKDYVDYVVIGEGENTITELARNFDFGFPEEVVSGICYMENGEIFFTEPRKLEKDISTFSFPARHLFDVKKYVNEIRFDGKKPPISLTSSRGCMGKCTFCGSSTTWGRTVRFRSPQNVVNEIVDCYEKYDSTGFIFVDDTFTVNRKHVIETCKLICDLPFKIDIFCSSRVDTIDEEKLKWMKKAGCDCITYGIESGDNEILKLMKKNTTVDMIKNAVSLTQENGIKTHGSFILGNYGDTLQTINQTIDLAIDLDLNQAQFSILVPLPGTECYQIAIENNIFKCDPRDYKSFFWYYSVVANMTDGVTDEELLELQKMAYKKWEASRLRKLGDI